MPVVKGPVLEGAALHAVLHRGSHLQIIAAAGSGKTEVVSQRVASLLDDGIPSRGVVAFTFTERAAAELRERIAARVEERLGREMLDRLNGMYVGTIHGYCFQLLQHHVPRYETFDVLDENQLNAFAAREANRLGVKALDPKGKDGLFRSIGAFLKGLDVIENELLDPSVVHAELRHLIVDEYQDVNPAQERLIELLAGSDVELCVVGDDDQAIYQWRGSDVTNIVEFVDRYPNVATFSIGTNRRSRPDIITTANEFARSIPDRLDKEMGTFRPASGSGAEVSAWAADYELDEAGYIANAVLDLHDAGLPYRDIAVLVRSRAAYRHLLEQFATFGIPVQPGGRTGLFDTPEARVLGRTLVWLAGLDWREGYSWGEPVEDHDLIDEYADVFSLGKNRRKLTDTLHQWRKAAHDDSVKADLIRDFVDTYCRFEEAGGVTAAAALLSFRDATCKRVGITPDRFTELAMPIVQ